MTDIANLRHPKDLVHCIICLGSNDGCSLGDKPQQDKDDSRTFNFTAQLLQVDIGFPVIVIVVVTVDVATRNLRLVREKKTKQPHAHC